MGSTGNITLARKGIAALETLRAMGDRTVPTADEREVLAQWPGWGPLAPALDAQPEGPWGDVAEQVQEFFGDSVDDDLEARECVDTAFYTPDDLIDQAWGVLRSAGFTGGKVLEPGCGSGRFMLRAPKDLPIEFTGVEKDHTSARIAAALNPDANIIHSPLQKTNFRDTMFDAVIGNVPFSSGSVYDHSTGGWWNSSLHAYFLGRALMHTRPGGYVVLITSRYLMDTYVAESACLADDTCCDFVGAVRLPTGAFSTEGTEVVADVLAFRRTDDSSRRKAPGVERMTGEGWNVVEVSRYWSANPEAVAGVMTKGAHHLRPVIVTSENVEADTARAFAHLNAAAAMIPMVPAIPAADLSNVVTEDEDGRPEGSFHVEEDGQLVCIQNGRATRVPGPGKELRSLVALKLAVENLMQQESDLALPDATVDIARTTAREAWEAYVAAYGPLNRGVLHEGKVDAETGEPALTWRRPRLGGFRSDPAYPSVMAIEVYDQESGTCSPAPILLRRVNRPPIPVTSAATPTEALNVSLGETGRVSLPRIAELLGLSTTSEAMKALGDLVFRDPEDMGTATLARTYLSGNVRTRLEAARSAAERDESYARNVAALEEVMPADLGPLEIRPSLGAPWIEDRDIQDFVMEVMGGRVTVDHCPVTGAWDVTGSATAAMTTDYGTSAMDAGKIIHCLLNGKPPVVFETIREAGRDRKVRENAQTEAAQAKAVAIQERFAAWVWEDPARSSRLCKEYNRRFNSFVVPESDGSHLTFPGMSPERDLWPWQRNMVDRIMTSPATMCGHAVGAGKTLTAIAAAMTLKRFRLANKPMIVVPNHLLEQIAREARQAYPMGKFLVAGQEDLSGDGRRLFAARCATGDWDAVVVTHSGFGSIPVTPQAERQFIRAQKMDYEAALRDLDRSGQNYFSSKVIARRLRSLEGRLEKLRGDKADPRAVFFEHLGVDFLAVDEAHAFKRLALGPSQYSLGTSKRATDLLLKMRLLEVRASGRPYATLLTGTPWTNSLTETFVWQTYLQADLLEDSGLSNLDTWMAQFAQTETKVEVAPDGSGFRMNTRPTSLRNVPELRTMFGLCADVLPSSALPLKRPDRVDMNHVLDRTDAQGEYVGELVERSEKLRGGASERPNDNMLVICGEGRRVALDPKLVGVNGTSPKVDGVAEEVARIYRDNQDRTYGDSATPGGLQIVFCDMGTPNATSNQTYGRLREALIERGVPAKGIRWIHEAKTDKAKDALFASCRDGSVSVLLGSTEKMGYGTNIQARLLAVHHMDAPWRPSDIEQREGRALRPGNLNESVEIHRYVVEQTFDAYMWQTLERKAYFMAQMMQSDSTMREIEDIADATLDYGQVKALATGNPELLELFTWREEVRRLRTLRSVDRQSLNAALSEAKRSVRSAELCELRAEKLSKVLSSERWAEDGDEELQAFAKRVHLRVRSGNKKDGYGQSKNESFQWRGCTVTVLSPTMGYSAQSERRNWELTVHQGYSGWGNSSLLSEALPVSPLRGSAKRAHGLLCERLEAWADQVEGQRAALREKVATLTAMARDAEDRAAAYSFPHEERLKEAEGKVQEIEWAIREQGEAVAA